MARGAERRGCHAERSEANSANATRGGGLLGGGGLLRSSLLGGGGLLRSSLLLEPVRLGGFTRWPGAAGVPPLAGVQGVPATPGERETPPETPRSRGVLAELRLEVAGVPSPL